MKKINFGGFVILFMESADFLPGKYSNTLKGLKPSDLATPEQTKMALEIQKADLVIDYCGEVLSSRYK